MAGLLGLLRPQENDAPDAVEHIAEALRYQQHRGPDTSNIRSDGPAVLGVNRLAVIDPENAHQPLTWGPAEDPQRYTVAFNGEIYNYLTLRDELVAEHSARFTTESDTEVLVAAYHHWGSALVERLRGMFAFLIWDRQRGNIFGARDPFGVKPLFYASGPGGIALSSEKKSLLALFGSLDISTELDRRAIQHYYVLQYVPEPESLHQGIRRIESGTSFTVEPGGEVVTERYFFPRFHSRSITTSDQETSLYQEISHTIRDSVRRHMRADRPVGAFLSGGIDSTAIAALAKQHNPNLITFTAGFQREGYSEVDVAAESAAAIGAQHVVRTVSAQEMMEALPSIVWYLDDPVADPALVPLWFIAREARQHVAVVLSGEGADEVFGGYSIYREPRSLAPFEKLPRFVRRSLGSVSALLPRGVRGKDLLRRGALSLEERYYGNARIFDDKQLRRVLPVFDENIGHRDVTRPWYRISQGWDPVARMQHVDLFTWLRGDILVKADKVTMANSLELRTPFLDQEVFRVASTLPVEQKISQKTTKYALRQALDGIVPEHVLHRRKLGFPVPIRAWLRDEMYEWARTIITESQTDDLLDKREALALLDQHRQGRLDHSRALWALLVFMLWHGIFVEGRIKPDIPDPPRPIRS